MNIRERSDTEYMPNGCRVYGPPQEESNPDRAVVRLLSVRNNERTEDIRI